MADVADKAVDRIVDALQKVTPRAWESALQQVHSEAVVSLLQLAAFWVVLAATFRWAYLLKASRGGDWDWDGGPNSASVAFLCAWSGAVILIVASIFGAGESVLMLSNPEFYAAQRMIEAVK